MWCFSRITQRYFTCVEQQDIYFYFQGKDPKDIGKTNKCFMPINALDSKFSKLPYIVAHTVESGFVETNDLTMRVDDNSNKDVCHKTWRPFSVPCWWQLEQECMS